MRILIVAVSLFLAVGCKGKSASQSDNGTGSSAGGSAPAAAAPTNPGAITLPKSTGTPPKKTAPLDQAASAKLVLLEFPGFKRDERAASDHLMEVRYKTGAPPVVGVTIRASRCVDCLPMELANWNATIDKVKQAALPEELRSRPDTTFELGKTELNGQPVIYSYQLGHFFGKDADGNSQGSYSHAYSMYFNDGVNMIHVIAQYSDGPVSREDLEILTPRADLEKVARAFLDTFTHAW